MARDEKRRDPGEFYPGGKVWVKPGQSQPQLEGAVQYDREQTLTDAQKAQARANIGVTDVEFDSIPTENSQKAARSGGIFSWVTGLLNSLTLPWSKVTDKPSTFPPSSHTHPQSQVEGLADALAAKRGMTDRSWNSGSFRFSGDTVIEEGKDASKFSFAWNGTRWEVYYEGVSEYVGWAGQEYGEDAVTIEGRAAIGYFVGSAFEATRADSFALTSEVPALAAPSESATDAQAAKAKSTYDFVNSSINAMAAFYITKNAAGDSFATKAELTAAIASGTFYNGGQPRTPTKNDYLYVLADESATQIIPGVNPTTRYSFDGAQWAFQIVVNNTALTSAQVAAINSGISAALVTWLAAFKGNDSATTLASVLADIAGKLSLSGGTITGDLSVQGEINVGGAVLCGGTIYSDGFICTDSSSLVFPENKNDTLALLSDILARIAPAYSATSAYAIGAKVTHNGALYSCKTAIPTGGETWNAAHWDALADLSGVLSKLKSDGTATDQFAADLLGKQVAISAIDGQVDARTKTNASTATTSAVELQDGGVVSVEADAYASQLTISFGGARQTNGLRFCELYVKNLDTSNDGSIASISGKVYSDISLTDLPKLDKGATYYFTFAEFKVTQETVEGETVSVSHWKVSKQKLDAMGGDIPTPTAA